MATQAARAWRPSATPLLALVVATSVLYLARELLIPLALAVLFAFVLAPLVNRFEGWRLGRVASTLAAVVLGIALLGGVGWVAGNQALSLAGKLPEYKDNIGRKLRELRAPPQGDLGKAAKALKELEHEATGEKGAAKPKPPAKPAAVQLPTTPLELLSQLGAPIALLLAATAAMLVVTTLMLLQRHDLRDRVVRLVGEGRVHVTTQAMEDAAQRVSRYLLTLLMVNIIYGTLLGAAFFLIGIPNALLWGLLSTVLRFVPYVGAPAAALMPLALAFAISDGWSLVFWTLAAIVVVDVIIAYMVEPWLYGARTGLSPIAVVIASVFWTWLWGPFGLLLATPLTVCIAVVSRYIPNLDFVSVILGADPVLTPPVRIYQRLVAYEYEDAYEVAKDYAKEHGLAALYDSVLLPALLLAKRDRLRYPDEGERERYILESLQRLIEELGDAEAKKREGEGAQPAAPALGIVPSHDEFDHLAGLMLARLLAPERFDALLLPQNLLAAEVLDRVAESCGKALCISAVPPSAASNAGYLCKRLRQRFPQIKIVVALWNADTNLEQLTRRLLDSGADEVVTRLPVALERIRLVVPPAARTAG